uniref:Uncharacterized protein n=1 Tax=Mus musculus TaxID=10090 RepID=Q8C4T4_MOUSE|nr:unnamed protein product [Mus musculus]
MCRDQGPSSLDLQTLNNRQVGGTWDLPSLGGAQTAQRDSWLPQEGGQACPALGPPRCLLAPLTSRCPRCAGSGERSTNPPRPQERPTHAAAPAHAPGSSAQPSAQPRSRLQQPCVPELRRAAAAGYGVVRSGAGGEAAASAPGGGRVGADPAALADRTVAPPAGTLAHSTQDPGLRTCRAVAGVWSHRIAGVAAHQA